jgi:methylase of polypeptide subunit release factors
MVGIESNPQRAQMARAKFASGTIVTIRSADFLAGDDEPFDFVIGNPPYVAIHGFSDSEKLDY